MGIELERSSRYKEDRPNILERNWPTGVRVPQCPQSLGEGSTF